ncbi:MAG TPA: radical SAM family heme chaperone HemW [Synergistaceae bacterium]|nr:radical SAM family heme chaperone HemW [Synergistaceae bacterium]
MEFPVFSPEPLQNFYKIYLHIPFCCRKCPYCAFYSETAPSEELMHAYIRALEREMACWRAFAGAPMKAETLYIGGGTPSLLGGELWKKLFAALDRHVFFAGSPEITVEANPGSLREEHLKIWKSWGVSRISLGVQSFFEEDLRVLRRPHDALQAEEAVRQALEWDFEVTLDLMFGLPNQILRKWHENLRKAVDLGISHISLYHLTLEEGTPWGEAPPENLAEGYPMYRWAQYYLKRKGLAQYEVASFARPGKEARHNLGYWRQEDVLGFGAGAWGYWKGLRYGHVNSVADYIRAFEKLLSEDAFQESLGYTEILSSEKRAAERAVLLLRTTWGIPLKAFRRRFGYALTAELLQKLQPFMPSLVEHVSGHLRLTPKGMRVANSIWSELL